MAATPLAAVVVVLIFAGASFFFSLAETSLFSLSKWQVRQLMERRARAGAMVENLLSKPQDLLATLVLGNTVGRGALDGAAGSLASIHNDRQPSGVAAGGVRGFSQDHGGAQAGAMGWPRRATAFSVPGF
jgi:hypothetical protein